MTHTRNMSQVLGLATLATLGLVAIQPAHAQISGFGSGSGTNANQFTTNSTVGDAGATTPGTQTQITGGTLQLTDNQGKEASSAYYNTKQSIANFSTSFTYRDLTGTSTSGIYAQADGFGFVLQNAGLNALGNDGGAEGYGGMVGASAAQLFEMYSGATTGFNSTTGAAATSNHATALAPVTLYNGNPYAVTIRYNGTNLYGQIQDTVTGAFTSFSNAVNLQTTLGGSTAYVGFTGGTGGVASTQQISNFTYSSSATAAAVTAAPIAITGLTSDVIKSSASDSTNSAFDAPNNYVFYAAAANATNGLPDNGTITSATGSGTTFQLGAYSGSNAGNALLLSKNTPITINTASGTNPATGGTTYSYSQTGTVTLVTAAKYSNISLLTASSNGAATLSITFNYVGGGTTTATLLTKDWFTTNPSATNMGRVNASSGVFDTGGTGGPHLYETMFSVDPTQTLQSISFAENATGTNTVAGIFAVSGVLAAAPEPGELAGMLLGSLGVFGLIARKRRANA